MDILITICGRAGSRGVKDKNIRKFLGKPLIKYSVASANLFKENNSAHSVDICVNSDSRRILNLIKGDDLTFIKRPQELARDNSPKVPVIKHSLIFMEEKLNKKYDYIIDLDITSPLRKVTDIENALNKVVENISADVVFSVVPSRRNPYFNMVESTDAGMRRIIAANYTARQQLPKVYDINASIYCYKRDSLLYKLEHSPLDGEFDAILMKDTAVLDIDSEEDFKLMEVLSRHYFKDEFRELFDYVKHMS
ncbi:MAG TPA: acylneuraminate cytidylyltransferase family protein [Ruminiclostridium sp.]|nr:acylneuraminate cytidylyltransferase family protein [Ruminiclostridium sp.]